MRISPVKFNVEGADGFARTRRLHRRVKSLSTTDLPGTKAQFETSRKHVEQERPIMNRREVGGTEREKIEAKCCERVMGVGPTHSSEEALEVSERVRRRGAKGWAEQGTRGSDR